MMQQTFTTRDDGRLAETCRHISISPEEKASEEYTSDRYERRVERRQRHLETRRRNLQLIRK